MKKTTALLEFISSKELYPIPYQGRLMKKEECNPHFVAMYSSKMMLSSEMGIYLGDDCYIYPCGYMG